MDYLLASTQYWTAAADNIVRISLPGALTAVPAFPLLNLQAWPYYLLILVRSTGVFTISPIFGRRNIPVRFRLSLALALSLIFSQLYPPPALFEAGALLSYVIVIIGELLIGLVIGYITIVFYAIPTIAGQLMDVQIGIGMGSVFDPSMGTQSSYTAMLLNIAMTVYFFIMNGHLKLIRILGLTYERIPVGQVRINQGLVQVAMESFYLMFSMSVALMLPIIGSALLSEVTMGVLMRAVPNFHAYMVGIPLKIIIGLVVLFAMQPFYITFTENVFDQMFLFMERMIVGMGG